ESGTGKELIAQAIHQRSPRRAAPFVKVSCAALPETLLESELFGHERGSFTGALARRTGRFEMAAGGTVFLDEIGDIPAGMQVKLLRALQEKKFTPVGSNREVEVNVRIIAATNRNLEEMIKKGEFREDLFYRLNVLPIYLPPLRERKDDIESLAMYFVEKFNQTHRKNIKVINAAAMSLLKGYNWPGNIRELENVIEHAFVIETTNEITPMAMPETIAGLSVTARNAGSAASLPTGLTGAGMSAMSSSDDDAEDGDQDIDMSAAASMGPIGFKLDINKLDFQANKEEFERQFLINALKAFKGRINQTAIHANIPKKTLLRKLEKYGINAREFTA
ncbi:MAG: sigma-54-dependent Fis family transcriptional regulator, partial [Deltaproteobacteria bacterium]|nr:sigma-54-dependent Fis family transcriptional regulator [Deltaproteobacteria bacterium]